jgi:hypothetical protein
MWLHGSVILGALLGLACVSFEPLRRALGLAPLGMLEIAVVVGVLFVSWCTGELAASVAQRARTI